MPGFTLATLAALVVVAISGNAVQAAIPIPDGLGPGDGYYLAFVTRDARDATSPDISDYDTFVQGQAALNPALTGTDEGVTWRALGSTTTIDAFDHLGLGAFPVYLLNGTTKVANGGADLWDRSIDAPIGLTQFAVAQDEPGEVWTGTNHDGTRQNANRVLGAPFSVAAGLSFSTNGSWVYDDSPGRAQENPLYAFSELLGVVPEPTTFVLAGLGLVGLGFVARRRKYRRAETLRPCDAETPSGKSRHLWKYTSS